MHTHKQGHKVLLDVHCILLYLVRLHNKWKHSMPTINVIFTSGSIIN